MFEVCRECGCTNFSTCDGGCWWVEDDLCSSCTVAVDVATGDAIAVSEVPAGWTVTTDGLFVPGTWR